MIIKPSEFQLQTLGPDIESLYLRLNLSMYKIIELVEDENRMKGFYNPKKEIIIECDDVNKFKNFQSLIKGLNNYVYYNSLILASYSIFEHALKSICHYISKHFQNSEVFEDKPRDIFGYCITYLKGTELINFKERELDKFYMEIKNVNKLRNLIAHFNGNIFKDKTKSLENQTNYNLFKSDKRLIIIANGQVYIDDSDFIKSFIINSEKFLKLIIEKLKNN